MKRIFFIVPVYKVERYLDRCVQSLLCQNYENTLIILVDDGSPDGCPAMCDRYASENDNVTVIHKKNGGLSSARNAGLRYVYETAAADKDDLIVFVDSDDFISNDYASEMTGIMDKYGCDIVQCGYEKGDGSEFTQSSDNGEVKMLSGEEALAGYDLKSQCWAKIFRAECFCGLYFPEGKVNEDEFVTYRAVYRAKNIVFTNKKMYYYFQHGESIMVRLTKSTPDNKHKFDYLKAYAERASFFKKENKPILVMRTYEKVCTDIILRYAEQMNIEKEYRDKDCVNGIYMKIYRFYFRKMIKRKGIPLTGICMHSLFYCFPYSAVIVSKIVPLRK